MWMGYFTSGQTPSPEERPRGETPTDVQQKFLSVGSEIVLGPMTVTHSVLMK